MRTSLYFSAVAAAARRRTGPGPSNGLLSGLVAFWRMEEASGAAADAHGDYDLTDNNSDIGQDTSNKKLGSAARVVSSAAAATRLTRASSDAAFNAAAFTVAGWFRITALTGDYQYIVAKDDVSAWNKAGFWLRYNPAVGLEFGVSDVSWGDYDQVTVSVPSLDTWVHFACGNDGSVNWLRINNGSASTVAQASMYANSAPLTIFGKADNTSADQVHRGQIDAVGFWSRKLTDGQLTALYNDGDGLDYAALS
jgi:hypothetical protein